MAREVLVSAGPDQRVRSELPSFANQLWETTRLVKHASSLEPGVFWDTHAPTIQQAFPGLKKAQILNHERVPVMLCARDEMGGNNIGITLLALAMQQDIHVQPVVIDNGSTDGTGKFAEEMGAIVVSEEKAGLPHAVPLIITHIF